MIYKNDIEEYESIYQYKIVQQKDNNKTSDSENKMIRFT